MTPPPHTPTKSPKRKTRKRTEGRPQHKRKGAPPRRQDEKVPARLPARPVAELLETSPGSRWRSLLLLLAIALALRLSGLASIPLWMDERYTLSLLDQGIPGILGSGGTLHPPGYALSAYPIRQLGGPEWWIRIPALIGGLLGVATIWLAAHVIRRPQLATGLGLLLACSVYHVYYSQEARGYSWLACATGTSIFAAYEHLARPRLLSLAVFLAASLAALSFHYMAAPTIGVLGLYLLLVQARALMKPKTERKALGGVLLLWGATLLVALAGVWLLRQRLATVESLFAGGGSTSIRFDVGFLCSALGRWSGLGAGAGLWLLPPVCLGLLLMLREAPKQTLAIVLGILAPLVAISSVPWPHRFELRYLMGIQIPILVALVVGLNAVLTRVTTKRDPRVAQGLRAGCLVLFLGIQLIATGQHLHAPRKYTPAAQTNRFGYDHVVLNSLLEPRLVRNLRTDDFTSTVRKLGALTLPLPPWRAVRSKLNNARNSFSLANPAADDTLNLLATEIPRRPKGKPQWQVITEAHPREERMGITRLLVGLPAQGVQFELCLRSARLDLVDGYFNEVKRHFGLAP